MGDNLRIVMLRVNISKVINEAALPTEVNRMILREFVEELTAISEEEVKKEMEEYQRKIKEEEASNGV